MGGLVAVGRVARAHGIRGEVVLEPLTDLRERFEVGAPLVLGDAPTIVERSRVHKGRLLVKFAGVPDRNAAERLRGLLVEAEPLDADDHEHLFVHELVGLEVLDADGVTLGRVTALVELPASAAYDLLEVARGDGTSWLLPAVDEFVVLEQNEHGGRLRLVDPPEGLVEATTAPGGTG